VFPKLKSVAEEEGGRKKIARWTRYGTLAVCLIQGYSNTIWADRIPNAIAMSNRTMYTIVSILTVTTGTMFLVWIGEQITKRGIGNGISLLIFAGIVARLPNASFELVQKIQAGEINAIYAIVVLLMFVGVVALVVLEQQGQRKIPVNYAKRVVGRKMYGAQNTYIPFKINPSGVIPVIFASSLLTFPLQIAQSFGVQAKWLRDFSYWLRPDGFWYNLFYVLFIIFFAYFYTQVSLNPQEISKNIRENGGSIPGIRSEKMEEHLSRILNRIILPGSLYLALIALIPSLVQQLFNFPSQLAYLLGGTSLLILVGVDLDTMSQVEAQLKMHHHDGLVRKGHIRSRNL
jgi:preprotein translocase subunit SecY